MMATPRVTGHVQLREQKRGSVWYLGYRTADGRQHRKALGPAWTERSRPPAGYYTKKTAQVALDELLTDIRRGTLAVSRSGVTFADAAAEYLRYQRDVRQRDPRDAEGVLNGYLLPRWGDRDLASITAKEIEEYRSELRAKTKQDGVTPRMGNRTINRHTHAVIGAIYKRALLVEEWQGIVTRNPIDQVERLPEKYDSANYKTLNSNEVMLVASKMTIPEERALVITAAFSGLRLGELQALRWEDVDFQNRIIHVKRSLNAVTKAEKSTKSGRSRSTLLMDEVIVALDGLSKRELFTEPGDLVFCQPTGEYLSHGMMRRRWYAALEACELPRLRLHDLRHLFGTLAARAFQISTVQGYLGHADVKTTQRYVHHQPRHEDVAKLQALINAEMSPTPELVAASGGNQLGNEQPSTEGHGAALRGPNLP